MVTFFYVLSGFVLLLAYYDKEEFSFKKFVVKRAARILPVYLIALSLSVAIKIFEGNLDPIALILNVLLLQSWFPSYPLAINGPGWFLSGLMFFYASFPLILSYLKKSCPKPQHVLFTSMVLWIVTQVVLTILLNSSFYRGFPSYSHDLIFYFPLSHFCSFFLGVSGAYFLVKNKIYLPPAQSLFFVLFSCTLFILVIENQYSIIKLLQIKVPYTSSFYGPFFLLIVAAFSISDKTITAAFSVKPFLFLGEISFSIYIFQNPILYIAYRLKPMNMHYDIFLFIYILFLMILGTIFLYTIEHPLKTYMKSKFN